MFLPLICLSLIAVMHASPFLAEKTPVFPQEAEDDRKSNGDIIDWKIQRSTVNDDPAKSTDYSDVESHEIDISDPLAELTGMESLEELVSDREEEEKDSSEVGNIMRRKKTKRRKPRPHYYDLLDHPPVDEYDVMQESVKVAPANHEDLMIQVSDLGFDDY